MVFSSQTFLFVFLPIVLLLYAIVRTRMRNTVLLLASFLFYIWGGGWFVGWLMISIFGNWLFGFGAAAGVRQDSRPMTRLAVGASVAFNIGILGWFKYANFFVDQLNGSAGALGIDPFVWTNIALPIGISFFTFQANSYVFDIAKGDAKPMRNPLNFALYVALFPQLIAGPIVRYHQVAEQLIDRSFAFDGVCSGAIRFSHGLCKKVIIADSVGRLADAAFDPATSLTTADAWVGLLAYTIQIYFDFSGYSDMAIGLGRMFGFRFPENFKRPYSSASMTEFWRRWHVTLSEWFRDYVYFPLGGSRGSGLLTARNLIFVFLITGFWHGANWTFIAWGIYHGFWLIAERLRGRRERATGARLVGGRLVTLLLVMLGWVVFRAESIPGAWSYYTTLFGANYGELSPGIAELLTPEAGIALGIGSLIFILPVWRSFGVILDQEQSRWVPALQLAVACVAMPVAVVLIVTGTFSPFLYFQF